MINSQSLGRFQPNSPDLKSGLSRNYLKIPEFLSPMSSKKSLTNLGENIVSAKNDINAVSINKRLSSYLSEPNAGFKGSSVINSSRIVEPKVNFNPRPEQNFTYQKPYYENPIFTSNHYREKLLKPIPPPNDKIRAIFAIYYIGFGADLVERKFGKPNGYGFLLDQKICVTAYSVIPDKSTGFSCYAQFHDSEIFKFDPNRLFAANKKHGFSILAFQSSASAPLKFVKPIPISEAFEFHQGDVVHNFPYRSDEIKNIIEVFSNHFTFASGRKENLVPGSPIFNSKWALQGMYLKSDKNLNLAVRMSPILLELNEMTENELVLEYLNSQNQGFDDKVNDRFLYIFEWHGRKVLRFDIDREEWENIPISNPIEDSWTFHWNSRLVYLPNGSVLIIGGRSKQTGKESKEVLLYSPDKRNLSRFPNMLTARDSLACVYIDKFVYVLGGNPGLNNCERVSVVSKKWQVIAPMCYVRHDASACTGIDASYIFVFGGMPLNPTGNTIERYSVKVNEWELLRVLLPKALARMGVFPITSKQIAILGGSGGSGIFIFRVEEEGNEFLYSVDDCNKNLNEATETVYPVAMSRRHNKVYVINCMRGMGGLPFLVEFAMSELDNLAYKPGRVKGNNRERGYRDLVRTPIDLQRPIYFM